MVAKDPKPLSHNAALKFGCDRVHRHRQRIEDPLGCSWLSRLSAQGYKWSRAIALERFMVSAMLLPLRALGFAWRW
jgi:hypothetical protein